MMELRDASKLPAGQLRGAIYGDTRGRFNDGEYVITTIAKETLPGIFQTKNSTYKVEFAKCRGVADKRNALTWEDTVVTCTIGQLTDAIAEALKVVAVVQPSFNIGDKLTIGATVTGIKQRHVSFVLDNVPGDMTRSFAMPAASLALAATVEPS